MPTLTTFPTHNPLVLPPAERGLLLISGSHLSTLHPAVLAQAARLVCSHGACAHELCEHEPGAHSLLRLFDCGNCLDLYDLARQVRRLDPQPERLLKRILVARAFTCYQVAALLAQCDTPAAALPVIVLDLLATFMDENVPLGERQRLLQSCLAHLRRLARRAPVLVTARSAALPGSQALVASLYQAADHLWLPAPAPAAYHQASFLA